MHSFIEILNQWGGGFAHVAWPMFWQSSLLILLLLGLDYGWQHRVRAAVRHALWLVVLLKLCLPPTFALPTSPVWWLPKSPLPVTQVTDRNFSVTFDQSPARARPLVPNWPTKGFENTEVLNHSEVPLLKPLVALPLRLAR